MGLAKLVPVVVLAVLLSSPASARSDCHQDMKDMLEGTLEVAQTSDAEPRDFEDPAECTLAAWPTEFQALINLI